MGINLDVLFVSTDLGFDIICFRYALNVGDRNYILSSFHYVFHSVSYSVSVVYPTLLGSSIICSSIFNVFDVPNDIFIVLITISDVRTNSIISVCFRSILLIRVGNGLGESRVLPVISSSSIGVIDPLRKDLYNNLSFLVPNSEVANGIICSSTVPGHRR